MMRHRIFGLCLVLVLNVSLGWAEPDCPPNGCPPNPDPSGNNNAADPVFMSHDPRPKVSLAVAQGQLALANGQGLPQLSAAETTKLKAVEGAIRANTSIAQEETMKVWRGDHSPGLKRSVIMVALPELRNTDERQLLQFMLTVLDDPQAQLEEIARLGRGNGLEKAKAARLLAVMKQNPQVAAAIQP